MVLAMVLTTVSTIVTTVSAKVFRVESKRVSQVKFSLVQFSHVWRVRSCCGRFDLTVDRNALDQSHHQARPLNFPILGWCFVCGWARWMKQDLKSAVSLSACCKHCNISLLSFFAHTVQLEMSVLQRDLCWPVFKTVLIFFLRRASFVSVVLMP